MILLFICISDKKTVVSVPYSYVIQLVLLKNDRGIQRRAEHLCTGRLIKNKVTLKNTLFVAKMGLRANVRQEKNNYILQVKLLT